MEVSEEILFSFTQKFYPLATKRSPPSDDSVVSDDVSTKKRRKNKGRTPSHIAKREEKKLLLKELAFLEAKAAQLRHEAGLPDPEAVAATETEMQVNRQLQEAIQEQQNAMATVVSAFAEFTTLRGHNPLQTFIHLSKDPAQRRNEVCALKKEHLRRAHRFLKQRVQLMADPHRICHEESAYLTDEGDYIATLLDVNHFANVISVKQVFDAMQFYFLNLEITTSELGDLTVREDSNDLDMDLNEKPMLHHRLVTMLSCGPKIEKNAIKFFQYVDDEEEGPYGIMAASPVDEDELCPYSPDTRFRKDISAAIKLSSFKRGEDELVVVVTRWFRVQLHRSELQYPPHVLQEVRRSVMPFTNCMIHSMNQSLYGAP